MRKRILATTSFFVLGLCAATPAWADATPECNNGAAGITSLECGTNSLTTGNQSTAVGGGAQSGRFSVAVGDGTKAAGSAVAVGSIAQATAGSTAVGAFSDAVGIG